MNLQSIHRRVLLGALLLCALGLGGCASGRQLPAGEDPGPMETVRLLFQQEDYDAVILELLEFMAEQPGSRHAEEAQFLLGRAYYEEGEFFEAESRFRQLRASFPGGEYAPEATYYLGLALLSQSRGAELDQSETRHALTEFTSFVSRYPDHPLVERAKGHIFTIRTKLGEKVYKSASFYHRRGRGFERAARMYLQKVLDEFGDTMWAAPAMLKLAESYKKTEEWEEAAKWARRLLDEHPQSEEIEEAGKILQRAAREGIEPAEDDPPDSAQTPEPR